MRYSIPRWEDSSIPFCDLFQNGMTKYSDYLGFGYAAIVFLPSQSHLLSQVVCRIEDQFIAGSNIGDAGVKR